MAVTVQVTRGFTAVEGVPIQTDDFNAGFLPSVVLVGDIIETGGVTSTDSVAGPYFTAESTGSGGAYVLTLTPAPTSLPNGTWVGFLANHANSGAATLNVNGLGAKAIVTPAGQALSGSEIVVGQPVWVQYYATGDHWRMYSVSSKPPPASFAQDTGTANAYAATYPGLPATALVQVVGIPLYFLASNANTGASTFSVNGLTATPILKGGGTALSSGDIPADSIVGVMYDGSDFKMIGFVAAPALPSVGATGTHVRPYSITVDAQGRVTSVTGATFNQYDSGDTALPTAGGNSTLTHGLGRIPSHVTLRIKCTDAGGDSSYAKDDEVESGVFLVTGAPAFYKLVTETGITIGRLSGTIAVLQKTSVTSYQNIDPTKWVMKVIAS